MEFNKINFEVLEECLMAAESKEYLATIFNSLTINSLDSELFTLTSETLPQSIKSLPATLSITNEKALTLVISLHNLMKEYIGTSMLDENILASKFPATFKKPLKTFLFKMMREAAP